MPRLCIHYSDDCPVCEEQDALARESQTEYVDYRIVPGYADHAATLAELQAVSSKFTTDGAAIAATFDASNDPREAIAAITRRRNLSVMRHSWRAASDDNQNWIGEMMARCYPQFYRA